MSATAFPLRARTGVLAVLLSGAAAATCATPADAVHLGVASCASSMCHGSAKPRSVTPVQQNEYVTWQHFDPHAGAFHALSGPRGREIARRLGIADITTARQCLGCHADAPPPALRGPRFQVDDGIGCESCHGAADRWIASHADTPRVAHTDNIRAGLRPLEQPAVRAGVCIDCHIGALGTLANHRMMAAGHPRLAFELDTYTELWRTSGGRAHYAHDQAYRERKGIPAGANVWIVGLLAQARRQLAFLRQGAGTGLLPEFALFNCYSCHRTMGLARWNERESAPAASSGALRFDDTSLRLIAAVLATYAPADATRLLELVRQLQAAPGANWAAVQRAATALDVALAPLGALPPTLSAAQAHELVGRLTTAVQQGEYRDYAGAEQVAMGAVVLLATSGQATDSPAVEALFASLADDERFDAARFRGLLENATR